MFECDYFRMKPTFSFPVIDARLSDGITNEDAGFFRDHGLLHLQNVISPEELAVLDLESMVLLDQAGKPDFEHADYMYATHSQTGNKVPFRIDYVTDKMLSARVLMAHPFVLRSVEMLVGKSFIPTWESKVFKMEGAGAQVNWHRDAGPYLSDQPPVFFADYYLDDADETTALRAIPGSHLWSYQDAMNRTSVLNRDNDFESPDIVVLPVKAGDVLFHHVHTLHGSPAGTGKLRRVIYFAFRAISVERITSPNRPRFIPAKQRILLECLQCRSEAPYVQDSLPFSYRPDAESTPPAFNKLDRVANFRIPHMEI
jgi:phytanoyl-CoA hydroxylase